MILIYCPYGSTGGPSEQMDHFVRMIEKAVAPVGVERLDAYSDQGRLRSYWKQFIVGLSHQNDVRRCKLVIVNGILNPGSWVLGLACARHGIPFIVVPHGDLIPTTIQDFRTTPKPLLKWALWSAFCRRLLTQASAVIVGSELEWQRLVAAGAGESRHTVIPPFVVQAPVGVASGGQYRTRLANYVLWMGRIANEKGLDLLFDCWPEVTRGYPGAQLVLAGSIYDKRLYAHLLRRRAALHLEESIVFSPYLTGAEKLEVLSGARCLALPSHYESFGIVVAEALVVGTPVLVSNDTPWQHLPANAGRVLPRMQDLWVAGMVEYLSAPTKLSVPVDDIRRVLGPFSECEVERQWKALMKTLLPITPPAPTQYARAL